MDYNELATKVKAKYPGVYDDMDNMTLAKSVVQKHPEYSDVTFNGQPQQPPSSVLDNAGKDLSADAETARRAGQGIIDFPSDVYQTGKGMMNGKSFSKTPIGQDVQTLGNTALQSLPHGVNENGSYKIEPGSMFRQYQDLAAQPLKYIPGKIGETMKQAYPGNPLTEHPVNSLLALLPFLGPAAKAVRDIPVADEGLNSASDSIRQNIVAPNGRRALGKFPMKMPIDDANQVGLDAVDKGVVKNPITSPLLGSRESMLGRANELNNSIGENIGAFLNGQNESLNSTKAMQELDSIKGQFLNDPSIVGKVNRAKNLIARNSTNPVQDVMRTSDVPQAMDFSQANKLKGLFQDKVNYLSDKATQSGGKAIASNFRNSIDTQLDDLATKLGNKEGMDSFLKDKKDFSSTRKMQDALEGQVNRDGRNNPISLPSVAVGVGGLVKGGGLQGALGTLAAEWGRRYGSATAASLANDVSELIKNAGTSSEVSPSSIGKAVIPAVSKPKTVRQNGHVYTLNEQTGQYE